MAWPTGRRSYFLAEELPFAVRCHGALSAQSLERSKEAVLALLIVTGDDEGLQILGEDIKVCLDDLDNCNVRRVIQSKTRKLVTSTTVLSP